MIRNAVLITCSVLLLLYVWFFALPKDINDSSKLHICVSSKDSVSIQHAYSFYFFTEVQKKYSPDNDTIFLSCKESTLANIFYREKLGYKNLAIDENVKVVSYCNIFHDRKMILSCN